MAFQKHRVRCIIMRKISVALTATQRGIQAPLGSSHTSWSISMTAWSKFLDRSSNPGKLNDDVHLVRHVLVQWPGAVQNVVVEVGQRVHHVAESVLLPGASLTRDHHGAADLDLGEESLEAVRIHMGSDDARGDHEVVGLLPSLFVVHIYLAVRALGRQLRHLCAGFHRVDGLEALLLQCDTELAGAGSKVKRPRDVRRRPALRDDLASVVGHQERRQPGARASQLVVVVGGLVVEADGGVLAEARLLVCFRDVRAPRQVLGVVQHRGAVHHAAVGREAGRSDVRDLICARARRQPAEGSSSARATAGHLSTGLDSKSSDSNKNLEPRKIA
mmetsp:Transcript_69598/g.193660  ORF Transcript_69598/g.193660 Transcript_69598/m.193660 type:complete len:331 (-) Transcript_69598:2-994(-)